MAVSCTGQWRLSAGQHRAAVAVRETADCGGASVVSELMRTGEGLQQGDVSGAAKT